MFLATSCLHLTKLIRSCTTSSPRRLQPSPVPHAVHNVSPLRTAVISLEICVWQLGTIASPAADDVELLLQCY